MSRLVISAAHTSQNPGAIYQGIREFDLTRKLLEKTLPHLREQKIDFQAVPIDLPLIDRINWINNTGYKEEENDIFLEIHVNDGGKTGVESWYSGEKSNDNTSQKFAEFFVDEFCRLTKYKSQGAKSELDHELGTLLILNQTKPIAIAVEFLYIDNAEDLKILKDDNKLDEIAKNIALVLKKYIDKLKQEPKPKPSVKSDSSKTFDPLGANPFSIPQMGAGLGGTTPPSLGGAGSAGSPNMMMDREDRKKMITKTYKKLLGKEPNQMELNQHLNVGTAEDQLIKKIIDGKDFEEMIKDAKEAKELRDKKQKTDAEVIKLQSQINDLQKMHTNLNQLLQFKNQQIKQMQDELVKRGITIKGEYYDPQRTSAASPSRAA